jgi:hypothetical protein
MKKLLAKYSENQSLSTAKAVTNYHRKHPFSHMGLTPKEFGLLEDILMLDL